MTNLANVCQELFAVHFVCIGKETVTQTWNRKEMTLMEYGVVVSVIFVIAIGIYASLKNKKKR